MKSWQILVDSMYVTISHPSSPSLSSSLFCPATTPTPFIGIPCIDGVARLLGWRSINRTQILRPEEHTTCWLLFAVPHVLHHGSNL